jgi:hypothetical protein
MPHPPPDRGDRLEKQYRRLGTREPVCVGCGESNPFCLELHHLAGQKHQGDTGIVCRNCHRKLTDQQRDHVPPSPAKPSARSATIGRYLLGLADLLLMIANALRDFGKQLMGENT